MIAEGFQPLILTPWEPAYTDLLYRPGTYYKAAYIRWGSSTITSDVGGVRSVTTLMYSEKIQLDALTDQWVFTNVDGTIREEYTRSDCTNCFKQKDISFYDFHNGVNNLDDSPRLMSWTHTVQGTHQDSLGTIETKDINWTATYALNVASQATYAIRPTSFDVDEDPFSIISILEGGLVVEGHSITSTNEWPIFPNDQQAHLQSSRVKRINYSRSSDGMGTTISELDQAMDYRYGTYYDDPNNTTGPGKLYVLSMDGAAIGSRETITTDSSGNRITLTLAPGVNSQFTLTNEVRYQNGTVRLYPNTLTGSYTDSAGVVHGFNLDWDITGYMTVAMPAGTQQSWFLWGISNSPSITEINNAIAVLGQFMGGAILGDLIDSLEGNQAIFYYYAYGIGFTSGWEPDVMPVPLMP